MTAVQLTLDLGPIVVVEHDRRRPTGRIVLHAHPAGEVPRRGDWTAAHAAYDARNGIRRLYHLEAALNPARVIGTDAWRPVVTVYPAGAAAVAL